jgi:hypothetical protein
MRSPNAKPALDTPFAARHQVGRLEDQRLARQPGILLEVGANHRPGQRTDMARVRARSRVADLSDDGIIHLADGAHAHLDAPRVRPDVPGSCNGMFLHEDGGMLKPWGCQLAVIHPKRLLVTAMWCLLDTILVGSLTAIPTNAQRKGGPPTAAEEIAILEELVSGPGALFDAISDVVGVSELSFSSWITVNACTKAFNFGEVKDSLENEIVPNGDWLGIVMRQGVVVGAEKVGGMIEHGDWAMIRTEDVAFADEVESLLAGDRLLFVTPHYWLGVRKQTVFALGDATRSRFPSAISLGELQQFILDAEAPFLQYPGTVGGGSRRDADEVASTEASLPSREREAFRRDVLITAVGVLLLVGAAWVIRGLLLRRQRT